MNIHSTKQARVIGKNTGWRSQTYSAEVTRPLPRQEVTVGQIPKSDWSGQAPHLDTRVVDIKDASDHDHFEMTPVTSYSYKLGSDGKPLMETVQQEYQVPGPKAERLWSSLAIGAGTAAIATTFTTVGLAALNTVSAIGGGVALGMGTALQVGAGVGAVLGLVSFFGPNAKSANVLRMEPQTDETRELIAYRQESTQNPDGTTYTRFDEQLKANPFSWEQPEMISEIRCGKGVREVKH